MSDESDPPALRLRPRGQPKSDDTPNSSTPDAASAASANDDAPPSLRLKPKLKPKPEDSPAAEASSPSDSAGASESKPRQKPRLAMPVDDAEPAEEAPVFRPEIESDLGASDELNPPEPGPPAPSPAPAPPAPAPTASAPVPQAAKPKLKLSLGGAHSGAAKSQPSNNSAAPPPAPPSSPFPPPSALSPDTQEPPDAFPPPAALSSTPPMLPSELSAMGSVPPMSVVTGIPVPGGESGEAERAASDGAKAEIDDDSDLDAPAIRKRLRPEQRPLFKIAILGAVLLLVVGIIGGGYYTYSVLLAPPPPPPIEVRAPRPAGPPPPSAEQLAAEAAAKVAAEAEMAAAMEAAQEEAKASIMREKEAAENAASIAPVIPDPSDEFLAWVSESKISGVREGSAPRAFINGRLVKQGDIIDFTLGITFDGVDPERNIVIFKEKSGAAVAKKY